MASFKSSSILGCLLIVALAFSSFEVGFAARNLLQVPSTIPPIPSVPGLPQPTMPNLPQPTLPNFPTTQPSLPKPTLPPLPSFPTMPTLPKVTLPPLPSMPSTPSIPSTIPSIPFLSPPPGN